MTTQPVGIGDVDHLVFDIDDTLYLERDYVRSGFRAVAVALGEPGFGARCWELFLQGERGNTFDRAAGELGFSVDVERAVEIYRTHAPDICLLDDARRCIETHRHGRLFAITDGPLESQRAKSRALGLDGCFEEVIYTAALGPGAGKPSRVAFELVEERVSNAGAEFAYVADNPRKDFLAPKALGWRTVRVRRPGALHEQLESSASVDFEITGLDSLAVAAVHRAESDPEPSDP